MQITVGGAPILPGVVNPDHPPAGAAQRVGGPVWELAGRQAGCGGRGQEGGWWRGRGERGVWGRHQRPPRPAARFPPRGSLPRGDAPFSAQICPCLPPPPRREAGAGTSHGLRVAGQPRGQSPPRCPSGQVGAHLRPGCRRPRRGPRCGDGAGGAREAPRGRWVPPRPRLRATWSLRGRASGAPRSPPGARLCAGRRVCSPDAH